MKLSESVPRWYQRRKERQRTIDTIALPVLPLVLSIYWICSESIQFNLDIYWSSVFDL
jgi:hypothetical protein